MNYPKIRLAYRAVIDNSCSTAWERYIFEDTYKEYLMQQQLFNNKEQPATSFRELMAENPKAEQLHFLTGIAANSYVQQLKGFLFLVPDALGNNLLPFEGFRFDIINTDITDISRHKVGVTFFSPLFTYLGTVNNCYLVSKNTATKAGYDTVMYPLQPQLAICYYEEATINDFATP
jgi:hypothetical protein